MYRGPLDISGRPVWRSRPQEEYLSWSKPQKSIKYFFFFFEGCLETFLRAAWVLNPGLIKRNVTLWNKIFSLFGLNLFRFTELCSYTPTEPLPWNRGSLDLGCICVFLVDKQSGERGIVSYMDACKQYWNSNSWALFFSLVPNWLQKNKKLL